ncbi:hypothetical protein HML84_11395 [Alcanivorax sp. IO_7]|nr:hypothetical protein HML84_11395 [Alcanivorax sp. IO_7]
MVFDHNNAFDTDFDPEDFLANHIFKDEARNLFSDYIEREFFGSVLSGTCQSLTRRSIRRRQNGNGTIATLRYRAISLRDPAKRH